MPNLVVIDNIKNKNSCLLTVKVLQNYIKRKMFEYFHKCVVILFHGGKNNILLIFFCWKLKLQKTDGEEAARPTSQRKWDDWRCHNLMNHALKNGSNLNHSGLPGGLQMRTSLSLQSSPGLNIFIHKI